MNVVKYNFGRRLTMYFVDFCVHLVRHDMCGHPGHRWHHVLSEASGELTQVVVNENVSPTSTSPIPKLRGASTRNTTHTVHYTYNLLV